MQRLLNAREEAVVDGTQRIDAGDKLFSDTGIEVNAP